MKFGIALGRLHPSLWVEVTEAADRLGYESVWLPEHLVLPVEMAGSPHPGEDHPPVPPNIPVFDAFAYLSFLAARTTSIRLATHVYNIGLRHPFVAARAIQTLDIASGGRAIAGVGASWLASEWAAVGLDFATRGRRVDEAIEVCIRLWTEEVVEHHGEFFDFGPVLFEPKPVQQPYPPIHVGGESRAALRRTARLGDGWVGMAHTVDSAARLVAELRAMRADSPRAGDPVEVTVGGPVATTDDVERWRDAGVDRLVVSPWPRSRDALDGLSRFADTLL